MSDLKLFRKKLRAFDLKNNLLLFSPRGKKIGAGCGEFVLTNAFEAQDNRTTHFAI